MNLDFEIETVIAIAVCIAIIFCVKYGLSFYIKLKILNEKKNDTDLFKTYLRRSNLSEIWKPGFDYDIDKERIEKRDKENAEKQK